MEIKNGYRVRAFDPRTLGVIKEGSVLNVGRKYARIDFGLTGPTRVRLADVVEVIETRPLTKPL